MTDAADARISGTGLSTEYGERQGDEIGPNVRQLNLEEMREDIADTVAEIRRRVRFGAVAAVAGGVALAVVAAIVTGSARAHAKG